MATVQRRNYPRPPLTSGMPACDDFKVFEPIEEKTLKEPAKAAAQKKPVKRAAKAKKKAGKK